MLELSIVGAITSLVAQWVKKVSGQSEWGALLLVVLLSVLGGLVYNLLAMVGLWKAIVSVFISANVLYSVVLKRFKKFK